MIVLHGKDGFTHIYPGRSIDRVSIRENEVMGYWDLRIVSEGFTAAYEIVRYNDELLTPGIYNCDDVAIDLWERCDE